MRKNTPARALLLGSVTMLVLAAPPGWSTTMTNPVMTGDPRVSNAELPHSDNGANVFVVGGGKSDFGTQQFDLSAHVGPKGDFGHWAVRVSGPDSELIVRFSVDVSCVHIHGPNPFGLVAPGNRGVISGVVDKIEPSPNPLGVALGQTLLLLVKDGGLPSARPNDDFLPFPNVFPGVSCKNIFYIADLNNVNRGDILIRLQ